MTVRNALAERDLTLTRLLATGSVGLTMIAYAAVLYHVTNVAGEPATLIVVLVAALLTATVLARYVSVLPALGLSGLLFAAGMYVYVATLPEGVAVYSAVEPIVQDILSLLTGLSILRIVNAGTWALAAAPGPTFLAWYLALRQRYLAGAAVAGAMLGAFILTGDAGLEVALLGAVGVAGAMGFGDIQRRRTTGSSGDVDDARRAVLTELAAIAGVGATVSLVPGAEGSPVESFGQGGGGGGTLEANLVATGDQLSIVGSINLSPKVRFTVESEQEDYWRVGSFDRYTGGGWVRTGGSEEYSGALSGPPGRARTVRQEYRIEQQYGSMPAAWKPVAVENSPVRVQVADGGSLRPFSSFREGETYSVRSQVPVAAPRELRQAGTDYSDPVAQRYTRLPDSTADRVVRRTNRITANADNPYDTARVIEQWLSNNRAYSLDVSRPRGDIAEAFLFEMDAGYCTYFATTMIVMLRTQGIPARFTVGYTPGERVSRTEWVARGLDAHAWVEVYFPDHGWIRFDPTPGGPRTETEQQTIQEARESGVEDVDTDQTGPGEWTPTPTPTIPGQTPTNTSNDIGPGGLVTPTQGLGAANGSTVTPGGSDDGGFTLPQLPTREQLGLGVIVAAGAVAGLQRAGVTGRAYRSVWLRYQPRSDPISDTRRAYERVEWLLAQDHRARLPGETVRDYVASLPADTVDTRVHRLASLYERATYAGRADESTADEAVALANDLVGERTRLPMP